MNVNSTVFAPAADRFSVNRNVQTLLAGLNYRCSRNLTEAKMGNYRRILLIAFMLVVGVTAFGLGANTVQATPPDPCDYFDRCEF
jgi:hypothetical protein